MSNATEQLVVSLEARIRDFEKNFAQANRTANDNFSRIERRAQQAARNLEKSFATSAARVGASMSSIGGMFGLGARGGAASIAGTVGALKEVASSVAQIGATADRVA